MTSKFANLLKDKPSFVNVGVEQFADSLRRQGFAVVHIEWSPPAGGDKELVDLLDKLL